MFPELTKLPLHSIQFIFVNNQANISIGNLQGDIQSRDKRISIMQAQIEKMESYMNRTDETLASQTLHIQQFVDQQISRIRSETESSCHGVKSNMREQLEIIEQSTAQSIQKTMRALTEEVTDIQTSLSQVAAKQSALEESIQRDKVSLQLILSCR